MTITGCGRFLIALIFVQNWCGLENDHTLRILPCDRGKQVEKLIKEAEERGVREAIRKIWELNRNEGGYLTLPYGWSEYCTHKSSKQKWLREMIKFITWYWWVLKAILFTAAIAGYVYYFFAGT